MKISSIFHIVSGSKTTEKSAPGI